MAKWWAPVVHLYALASLPQVETYDILMQPGNVENNRPNTDLRYSAFTNLGLGVGNNLVASFVGYYDDSLAVFKRKIIYHAAAGPQTPSVGIRQYGGGIWASTETLYYGVPESPATQENSVYWPFALYCPKVGDGIVGSPTNQGWGGSNGIGGSAGQYNSQSRWHGGTPGGGESDPVTPNILKDFKIWIDDNNVNLPITYFRFTDSDAQPPYSAICGGKDSGLTTYSGKDARFHAGGADPLISKYFTAWKGTDQTTPVSSLDIPALTRVAPGDGIPLAVLLVGRNIDGADGYNAGPPAASEVVNIFQMSWKFSKVDRVFANATLTSFV